jgi:hypothetical protein
MDFKSLCPLHASLGITEKEAIEAAKKALPAFLEMATRRRMTKESAMMIWEVLTELRSSENAGGYACLAQMTGTTTAEVEALVKEIRGFVPAAMQEKLI